MIKINFALRKTSSAVMTESAPGSNFLQNLFSKAKMGSATSGPSVTFKDMGMIVVALAFGYLAMMQVESKKESEIAILDTELQSLRTEQEKLKVETEKIATYEALRQQVEADEKLIRNKLETIQKLMSDRNTPARLLLSLSQLIPADVWLREFRVEEKESVFVGSAIGFSQVSDFMKLLNETLYFKNVQLRGTEESKTAGMDVKNFELVAERK